MAEVKRDALKPCGLTLPAVTPISGPSAQLNLFSFITPIDLNRLVGASVLKSRCGAHYALSAKKLDSAERCSLPLIRARSTVRIPRGPQLPDRPVMCHFGAADAAF